MIMKGVTEVEGMGWLSIIVDPTGAILGLWEPKENPRSGARRTPR
jgi:predicted enzyme related to lactoylglutathione lyase